MSKALTVCAAGVHWGGADLKKAHAHLPFLPLMQSQGAIFHTDAVENPPGCDHLAQTTKLRLLFQTFPPFSVLNSWTFVFVSCVSVVWLEPALWGWLTSVLGMTQRAAPPFQKLRLKPQCPFWPPEVMSSSDGDTMAGLQAPGRLQRSLMWSFSLPHHPQPNQYNYLDFFFLMEEPWGLVFCFINHNLKLMSREKDS